MVVVTGGGCSLQGLKEVDLEMHNYMQTLELAVQHGLPVLLKNIHENLDPALDPILNKSIIKIGEQTPTSPPHALAPGPFHRGGGCEYCLLNIGFPGFHTTFKRTLFPTSAWSARIFSMCILIKQEEFDYKYTEF